MVQFNRERSPKFRVVRGRFESESRGLERKNADSGRSKGKLGKATLSGKYRSDGKLKDIYDDYSDEDKGNGDRLHLRKERSTKIDCNRGKKDDYEVREISADVALGKLRSKKAERFEKSDNKLGSKGKRMGRVDPIDRRAVDFGRSKGKLGKATLSGKYRSDGKLKDIYDDYSDEDKGNGDRLHLRKERSTKIDCNRGKKGDYEVREISADVALGKLRSKKAERFEKSDNKLGLKGKRMGRVDPIDRRAVGSDDESEKQIEKKDEAGQITKPKHERFQTRILDKTGKKIRVNRKALTDDAAESNRPLKKKKRVIKLDPHDISNKRLDDSVFTKENVEEEKLEMSKNAQFRAIQPTPAILSFVEDNLLGRRRLIELQNAGYNVKLSAPLDNVPFSTSTERERIEENVFRSKLEFFAAAKISSSFPAPMIPEIAFAGRSNVGKSSLLNALTRQWGVVRTSDKPGLTQTINFFRLASKFCLVDLPGYGFAYAKEEVKDAWEELVKEYVSTRVGLQQVCVLVDTKWGMKPRDRELIDLMERSKTPYQIVLTKTDLVVPIDVARRAMQIQEDLKSNKSIVNPVMMVSSKSGAGIRSFRTVLAKLARFVKP